MDSSLKDSDSSQKKSSLEDLSKEDLIKKCKHLLLIAQKAKQAKDEAGEEIKQLKDQLNKYEEVRDGTDWQEKEKQLKNEISTMEEMLSSLTNQKLHLTMEADNLKKHTASLENQIKQYKLDENNLLQAHANFQAQIEDLETTAESYKRQTNRLSDENESLIQKLEALEIEMRRKEEQFTAHSNSDKVKHLEDELQVLREELDCVKQEDARKKDQMKQLFENFSREKSELESKLEEETRKSNELFNSKSLQMKNELEVLSSRVSQLNAVRLKLAEDAQSLKAIVHHSQQEIWSPLQKMVGSYVETEIAVIKKENSELLGEMNEMNQVLKQRGETISKLKEYNNELDQQLKETSNKFSSVNENLKSTLSDLESKDDEICELKIKLDKIVESNQEGILAKDDTIKDLEKEVVKFKECQHELETKTLALETKEETIHNLEAELIKQKGKLQEVESKNKIIFDLEKEIEKLKKVNREQDEMAGAVDGQKMKEHEDEVSRLKARIQQLEREIEELRKENGDAPSEIMSSSTISKAEESARLKDLEESFEERYTKLRTVAVRLKKKVSELTAQQTQMETDKKKLSADKTDLQAKLTQLSSQAKNLQSMQQEYDRLQDELESQKVEVKQLTKTLEAAINESATIKVQLQECQLEKENKMRDLEVCLKDKQNLETANKELSSQVLSLKKDKETENMARKEKEKELKRLEDEVKTGEKKLAEEIEHHKNTQEQLEITKQECKKRSVLSLEMEDYERSVADLTQQLTAEKVKAKELDNHLDTQRDISRGLQEQISLLEQRIQSEEARSKEVKDQLNVSRMRVSDLDTRALEQETTIAELTSQIEHHREENENLVLQLSELAAEKQRLVESGRNQQDGLVRQVHILEEHVSRLKENLAERETELGDLRAEFGNYKVRAQSVLRQKARPEDGASTFSREDFMEELAQLRQTADLLKNKLENASGKLQTLTVENSAIQEERTRISQRCQELVDTVQDLRSQNSQLQEQLQEMSTEHREALKSQKLQADTLNQCYKQQLEELEERLQMETSVLKQQLHEAEEQLNGTLQQRTAKGDASSKQTTQPKDSRNNSHWNSSGTGFIPVKPTLTTQQDSENRLEITMLEREEGEGSESVDSASPRLTATQDHRTELIPLDKLLSSPSEDDVNASSTSGASPSIELGRTKEQLVMSECRIRHLTGLLSEAERDLAKLTQQNQVLKEEIRRQQRSVEREQHAQNFEYLKNVVLKFVTLQGGDERSRLVPVLNTILKLSPEEANQLNIVAKGGPDLQAGGKGWGSYLSLWSGTQ